MNNVAFKPADVLLPVNQEMTKWSCVACDQHTSEPEYWTNVENFVGENASTLKIMLPEVYLGEQDVSSRIEKINGTMLEYLNGGIFREVKDSFVYVERRLSNGAVRKGIVGAVDLECYDYKPGSKTLIRATEGTVEERIPPRVKVRQNAALELPHIMLLIDDPQKTVIEPLGSRKGSYEKAYGFELMQGGGSITGYIPDKNSTGEIMAALSKLADKSAFEKKYGAKDCGVLLFAAGDGNHSLATAKAFYESLRNTMPEEEFKNHPARYALAEIVNVHDEALDFEPIHRVLFRADPENVLKKMGEYYDLSYEPSEGQKIGFVYKGHSGSVYVKNPSSGLPAGTLQNFLDAYTASSGGKTDYIHGDSVAAALGGRDGNIAFLLPKMEKSDLFKTVISDGALPRKTFSMGNACDKRYYLECRRIRP